MIILFSDGEALEGSATQLTQALQSAKITLYTVGIGTASGELIPIKNPDGSVDFLRDDQGKPVQSHLDAKTLEALANQTGGFYSYLSTDPLLEQLKHKL